MKKCKSLLAGLLAVILLGSVTGCSGDTTWVLKTGEETIPAGVYISYLQDAYSEAQEQVGTVEDFWAEKIEETPVEQWIINRAIESTKQFVASNEMFDELGLTLDTEGKNIIQNNADTFWAQSQESCEKNGISYASVKLLAESSYKTEKIFDYFYEVGGKEEVTEDEIKTFFYENYAKVKYLSISRTDLTTGEKIEDAELTEKLDGYVTRMNKGESIDTIIDEYMNELYISYGIESGYAADTSDADRNVTLVSKTQSGNIAGFAEKTFAQTEFDRPYTDESDESFVYFGARYDLTKDNDLYETQRDNILHQMKIDEFVAKLNAAVAEVELNINERSINRYSPKKLK